MTSDRGKPSTATSRSGRRTTYSTNSTASYASWSARPKAETLNRAPACSTPRASKPPRTCRPRARASTQARRSQAASAISESTPSASCWRSGAPQPASFDNVGGIHLLSRIAAANPHGSKAWTDTGYRTKAIDHGAGLGIDVEVVRRDPAAKGFQVIPRRWVVERTFGWLMHHGRLASDYETHPHRSEVMIRLAMIDPISRRLTRETTLSWRDT